VGLLCPLRSSAVLRPLDLAKPSVTDGAAACS
jgi:hypothetical protein